MRYYKYNKAVNLNPVRHKYKKSFKPFLPIFS